MGMRLEDYIYEKEMVHAQAEVYNGKDAVSDSEKGTLACTSQRIVYVSGKDVTDISINAVDAMEYSQKRFPQMYAIGGSLFLLLALVGFVVSETSQLPMLIAIILGSIGGCTLVLGFVLRRASLQIHTPGQSFTFSSGHDLSEIAHMIRGHEAKNGM